MVSSGSLVMTLIIGKAWASYSTTEVMKLLPKALGGRLFRALLVWRAGYPLS